MIKEPYRTDKPYGAYFESTVLAIKDHIELNDDDHLMLMAGKTGSGKSTQGLHAIDVYLPLDKIESLKYNLVSQSKESFATNQNVISTSSRPRILIFDEANVSKRQSMSKFNNDLLDLYYANRGLNIFHIWCNPSLDIIDMAFIEERINGVMFFPENNKHAKKIKIRGESDDSFRYYYYFNKNDIKKIYAKEQKLTNDILSKHRNKAQFLGWFNKYRGPLREVYLKSKDDRMINKSVSFRDKYGESDLIKRGDMERTLDVNRVTTQRYLPFLKEGEDYVLSVAGRYSFTKVGVENLKKLMGEKHKNMV